ncbi:SMP-30/gluconolactonase/LRE family protein [Bradyrhizobium sp. Pha-3]|uniref:SMP-30/gluconolactonase/LRE family protein n=1 Tax=Bradyrhizobium sp. Pha-3 TaxID=208375 RepID=UPI0035D4D506
MIAIRFTNGIAFGPDNHLYANAPFTGEIYRYDVLGEAATKRVVFGNVLQPDSNPDSKGPDGMAFGTDGRLYCTVYNQKSVTVLDRQGEVADRLILDGPQPTNCAFTLDGKKLRVTEVGKGQVEEIDMPCEGLPLHLPKFA